MVGYYLKRNDIYRIQHCLEIGGRSAAILFSLWIFHEEDSRSCNIVRRRPLELKATRTRRRRRGTRRTAVVLSGIRLDRPIGFHTISFATHLGARRFASTTEIGVHFRSERLYLLAERISFLQLSRSTVVHCTQYTIASCRSREPTMDRFVKFIVATCLLVAATYRLMRSIQK